MVVLVSVTLKCRVWLSTVLLDRTVVIRGLWTSVVAALGSTSGVPNR